MGPSLSLRERCPVAAAASFTSPAGRGRGPWRAASWDGEGLRCGPLDACALVRAPRRSRRLARALVRSRASQPLRAQGADYGAGCGPRRGVEWSRRAGGGRQADRARRGGAGGRSRGRLSAADERRMIRLTLEPFDLGAELTAFCAGRTESGAVASFVGIARGDAGATTALELEAYPGFTEAQIGRMAETATARFSLHDVLIVHRHGPIAPGEPIVMVATASGHRREAFEACDYLMDYLKSRAPFWKKEHGPGG